MRYFVIGENIPKTEITAEEAEDFRDEDDYRLIITDDAGHPIRQNSYPAPKSVKEPTWVPFDFGPVPEDYSYTGYDIIRYDNEGLSIPMESIPTSAVKTADPNRWKMPSTPGCYDLIVARPHYRRVAKPACGECAGCNRITCTRRSKGVRCRNYRH